MTHRVSNNLVIMPGMHIEIDHHIFNKTSQARTKMQWAATFSDKKTVTIKTVKTGYNLGATLLAKYKTIEILPSYNLHLRGKYISHQCSFKIKVLF